MILPAPADMMTAELDQDNAACMMGGGNMMHPNMPSHQVS